MGWFGDFCTGVANGAMNSGRRVQVNPGIHQLQAMCSELNWGIDEHIDEKTIALHFKDPVAGIRKVTIVAGDKIAHFSAMSTLTLPIRNVPPELAFHLLIRNSEANFSSWAMIKADSGKVMFVASFTALIGGLDARTLNVICQQLCLETREFDERVRDG
jgi:hypothetical protein